jgi:hypothetical protein
VTVMVRQDDLGQLIGARCRVGAGFRGGGHGGKRTGRAVRGRAPTAANV